MKRTMRWIAVAALMLGAGRLNAQRIMVGAGLLMPMGTYKDADKMGFIVQAGVGFPAGPVGIRIEGDYGQTSHKSTVGTGNTKIIGGMADVVYHFKSPSSVRPYVLGGLGMYNVKITLASGSGSETKLGFGAGAGLEMKMTGASLYLEARYMNVTTSGSSTAFIPITVGVRF
jgi:opacity protein-like surface antigen